MAEYVYFMFSFPIEEHHFHKCALSTEQEYSQLLRDTFIQRFGDSGHYKAKIYLEINERAI